MGYTRKSPWDDMKVSFHEIASRITGFSTPIFGVSWNPPISEVEVAKQLITYLEDRRVLYTPLQHQGWMYVNASILDIRKRLNDHLEKLDRNSELAKSLFEMRAACRKYLDRTEKLDEDKVIISVLSNEGNLEAAYLFSALGEFRALFGIHVAQIAVRYGVDVERSLATIFPPDPREDTEDTW